MIVLAIDTALPAASVCVMRAGMAEPLAFERVPMPRGHDEIIVPMIERVCARIKGGLESIDRVAVTVGPGSFTGIRIGIAAARAIGLARDIPVVGVSTFAAFAAPFIGKPDIDMIAAAIDARHGQVYMQAFGPGGRIIQGPRMAPAREAVRGLGSGRIGLVGTGAPMMAIEAWSMGLPVEVLGDVVAPDISFVARLGLIADPAHAPPRPLYMKAPDVTMPANAPAPAQPA